MLFWIAGAVVLAFSALNLHAQCSSNDNPNSFGCQSQQASPSSSTALSPASLAVISTQEQPAQETARADSSTEASADNSVPAGSNYTERIMHSGPKGSGLQSGRAFVAEPPTEFQQFVAATLGRMLPIYGTGLFDHRQASFGPIDQAPAPQNMVVGAGDELRIRIWGQVNFSANLHVSREGEIYLPKAGTVHVAGLPFSAVASQLRQSLDRIYRNYDLSVDMGEIHSIQVYLTGQARQPGEYTVSALSTLVDAIFLSGGPAAAGSMRHVELKREGKVLTDFDLYALLVKGDKTGDMPLQSGDVLFIPATGAQVAMLGSVRQEAIYELRGQQSFEELLDAAGGRTAIASGGRISVERIVDHTERRAFQLTPDAAGLQTPLADGDIVRIDPIVSSYRDTVTLRGSLANPGRFLWHEGMRLSELMPDRDSLETRGYWWQRTQLGFSAPEFAAPSAVPHPSAQNGTQADTASHLEATGSTLGRIAKNNQAAKGTGIQRPTSETDWNYAVIERLDRTTMATSLISFDLGKLVLQHDSSQDLELRPGDTVTIFSQDDIPQPMEQQTKYVSLEGEIAHAGVYSVQPGETLRSLVMRAGGLTNKAYLYGSQFTRVSTQAVEQQRLNEYADRLEHQLLRASIKMDSTEALSISGNDSQQKGPVDPVSAANREMVRRLRLLQSTGRIVLNLHPRSAGESELPETPLEDGDTLVVPSTPATVQVMGAVLNQNAFLYRQGARAGEYLHLAGGLNRDADRGQIFILRADGSVTGHNAGQPFFASSSFESARIYPGDTIVVPEKNIGPGAMHSVMAWTQIFSQFALGAAAISVLK
jgi:protein involved in polysaccharide export with SLBB domain